MGEKGDASSKKQTPQQQDYDSSSPKDPLEESVDTRPHVAGHHPHLHHQHQHPHPQDSSLIVATPFISAPLYVSAGASTSPFEAVNPKRTRYTAGQWKLLPSPSSQPQMIAVVGSDSSPSPSQRPTSTAGAVAAASSSDTASSPSHSPLPSLSTASGQQETGNKAEGESQTHPQYRKGKYVSPVWKPNEMLWLARAWRVQYQGGGTDDGAVVGGPARGGGKTRADKDREVAEFLQKHGVNRDAKTAGTKWDNMLGEFRKVYEWERGGEREQLVGKSYFRLSPYERKLHRLPASFDEQVFEELSQFMGSKMRTKPTPLLPVTRALPPPPPFREHDLPLSARAKQVLGLDYSPVDTNSNPSHSYSSKEVRRIGKVRMVWEESVSLWGEEGEPQRGRIRVEGCSFLNAEELTFFDESMVACTMESYDDGPLKGFSVDRFVSGQQIKVFGRRKSPSAAPFYSSSTGPPERLPLHSMELSARANPSWDYQDPTEYYVGCLRIPPPSLPSLSELSWHLQDPPSEELRFPIRKDVYGYLPQGKELFFTTSTEMFDCRSFIYEILCPIIRSNNPCISSATTPSSRDSFIGLWDDCINRLVSEFCCMEMAIIRKPNSSTITDSLQDQWPNVTGFIRNFCLWRGEETDQVKDGHLDPSNSIVEKLLWTYLDIPYLLGYYAVGYLVTFCALSRAQDRVIRTDLYSLDLSTPGERLKALVPCYRIAGVLSLLADRCYKLPIYSDFERIDLGNGTVAEMTPNTVTKFFSCRRKWVAVKEIYDFLDHRIPHSEFIFGSSEKDLALVFKPRVCRFKPTSYDQLIEALKNVTKALVALHDLCFMHRDISWEKVTKKRNDEETATAEWILCGFEEAVGAPQIYPHGEAAVASGRHAPEMERGLHGVKVDMWGVGYLIKTCGLSGLPKMFRELQNRCMDQNPEHRPTAADCYHHLLQLQSSLSTTIGGGGGGGGGLM